MFQGCGSSNEIQARTMEAPPEGVIGLDVFVTSPRNVQARWNPVSRANGAITYTLYFEGLFYYDPGQYTTPCTLVPNTV